MAKITFDTDALMNGASKIKDCIDNINGTTSGLSSLMNNIADMWHGSASETYSAVMAENSQKVSDLAKILQDYQEYVEKTAETFTKLDNDSANRIRSSF